MRKNKSLRPLLLTLCTFLGALGPQAWAQSQRTVAELIDSIKLQKERELDQRSAPAKPSSSEARTTPPNMRARPQPASAPKDDPPPPREPSVPVERPAAPQSSAAAADPPSPPASQPPPQAQVLSVTGVNHLFKARLLIDQRRYWVDGADLPQEVGGWTVLSIDEDGVCLARQARQQCMRPGKRSRSAMEESPTFSPRSLSSARGQDAGAQP